MDSKAQQRLYVLTHLLAGELTVAQAAAVLHLSTRQVDRLARRFRADGALALIHGNRSRSPVNRIDEGVRGRLVELATTEFAGFNSVHLRNGPNRLMGERHIAIIRRPARAT